MTDAAVQQMLDELFSALETLGTQTAAVLQFLKDRKLATEEDLAPFLEKAANASNVRWRAARVRINYLLATPPQVDREPQEKSDHATEDKQHKEIKEDQATQQLSHAADGSEKQEIPAQREHDSPDQQEKGATQ